MAGEPVAVVGEIQNRENAKALSSEFGTVHLGDMAQFQGVFNGRTAGAASVAGVASESTTQNVNMYNKMLAPLYEFRQSFDKITRNISDLVGRGNISMSDLFSVQFQLMQLGYMNDLSAKTADKLSQGIQTLFRNQG
jgi:hypothetical protein